MLNTQGLSLERLNRLKEDQLKGIRKGFESGKNLELWQRQLEKFCEEYEVDIRNIVQSIGT